MKSPPFSKLQQAQQLKELQLFKFFQGQASLPKEFELQYLCDVLKMSYTELVKQPADWVDKMLFYFQQKSQSDNHSHKVQEARAKAQQLKKPNVARKS
jgi:hypothetical protein